MTLPSSPPLSLTQILAELGRLEAGQSLSGAADERALSDRASGSINFSDYLGKSVTPPYNATIELAGSVSGTFGTISLGSYVAGRRILLLGFLGNSASFNPGVPNFTGNISGSIVDYDTTGNGSSRSNGIVAIISDTTATSGTVSMSWSTGSFAMAGWLAFKLVGFGSQRAINVTAFSHGSSTNVAINAGGGVIAAAVYPSGLSLSSGVTSRGSITFPDSPEEHKVVYGWDVNHAAGTVTPGFSGTNVGNGGTVYAGVTFNEA